MLQRRFSDWLRIRLQCVTLDTGQFVEERLTPRRTGVKGKVDLVTAKKIAQTQTDRLLENELVPVNEIAPEPSPIYDGFTVRGYRDLGKTFRSS